MLKKKQVNSPRVQSILDFFVITLLLILADHSLRLALPSSLNTRYAFGLLPAPYPTLVAVLLLIIWLYASQRLNAPNTRLPIIIITSAGFYNAIQRFIYGGIIDYFHLFGLLIFNLADIAVVSGLGWLTFKLLVNQRKIPS